MMTVSPRRMRFTPFRRSLLARVKRRASSARDAAYASAPIRVARMWPEPDDTKLPDNTSSPTSLSTASASPVSSDSSKARPWAATTSPSTTT